MRKPIPPEMYEVFLEACEFANFFATARFIKHRRVLPSYDLLLSLARSRMNLECALAVYVIERKQKERNEQAL